MRLLWIRPCCALAAARYAAIKPASYARLAWTETERFVPSDCWYASRRS